jgi:predicted O-methyltransferase YrrM
MSVDVKPEWPAQPESRFTEPTKRCPHPERWTSTDSESTEIEVMNLVHGLVLGLQPDAILETGTAFGEMARNLCDAIEANGHGHLWSIENDPVRLAKAMTRLRPWGSTWTLIGSRSLDWTPPDDIVFDLCYFDAYYRERVAEFEHFRPWMRVGTICCFHDTAPGHGIEQGDDIMTTIAKGLRHEVRMIHLPTPRGLTLAEVLP